MIVIADSCSVLHAALRFDTTISLVADRLLALHEGHWRGASKKWARLSAIVRVRANEVVGEPGLERDDRLEILDVFGGELDVERFDVVLEVLDLAAVEIVSKYSQGKKISGK